ncbi:hypothetical protein OF377_00960 [Ureaplasma sp. ES3154-GEN]|uniref:hypothetical protein n=1 Tax=Ureaplasma sp. ES3154-GEN TaxID=2984844 RepID=UPI0021E6F9C5|nr:hypothetical protein [Ureaplasma sp. ES3154-GEN]MCV3743458.1 hypothetical protein [Ureaplasma sp. ES3154-GEN]
MKHKKWKLITILAASTALVTTIPAIAAACQSEKEDSQLTELINSFETKYQSLSINMQTNQKPTKKAFDDLVAEYKKTSNKSRLDDLKNKMQIKINQLSEIIRTQTALEPTNIDDHHDHHDHNHQHSIQEPNRENSLENLPGQSKLALNITSDPRFNTTEPWPKRTLIDNQYVLGKELNIDEENELMIYNWYVLNDDDSFGHDHHHDLEQDEVRLVRNTKTRLGESNSVINFVNNDNSINKNTGVINDIILKDIYNIFKHDHSQIQLRIDGVGAWTDSVTVKSVTPQDGVGTTSVLKFTINDLNYLKNHDKIRITGVSFQHTHHHDVYNQHTIQFKDPVEIIVK